MSHGLICQFVVWSLVAGKMLGFSCDLGIIGHFSQVVVLYRSDSLRKRSMDGKMVVCARWSFITGVSQTREYSMTFSIIPYFLWQLALAVGLYDQVIQQQETILCSSTVISRYNASKYRNMDVNT